MYISQKLSGIFILPQAKEERRKETERKRGHPADGVAVAVMHSISKMGVGRG